MSELPKGTILKTYVTRDLPRMVLPDLAWLGGCSSSGGAPLYGTGYNYGDRVRARAPDEVRPIGHGHCVAFVIMGSQKTLMLDPGHFALWYAMDGQLDTVLKGRPLDYVFVSHPEIPHTGNLGRLLAKYPNCVGVGDVRDYHLIHPEIDMRRLKHMNHEDKLDLGDRDFIFLDAIWKDLSGTMYGYDTKLKLIFTPDLFEYGHMEAENICGKMLHELPPDKIAAVTNNSTPGPFFGMNGRDQKGRVAAFRNLLKKYPVEIITSGHYAPIMGAALTPAMDKTLAKIVDDPRGFVVPT